MQNTNPFTTSKQRKALDQPECGPHITTQSTCFASPGGTELAPGRAEKLYFQQAPRSLFGHFRCKQQVQVLV